MSLLPPSIFYIYLHNINSFGHQSWSQASRHNTVWQTFASITLPWPWSKNVGSARRNYIHYDLSTLLTVEVQPITGHGGNHGHKKSVTQARSTVSKKDTRKQYRRKREICWSFFWRERNPLKLFLTMPPTSLFPFKTYALMSPLWSWVLNDQSMTNALDGSP